MLRVHNNLHMHSVFRHAQIALFLLLLLVAVFAAGKPDNHNPKCQFIAEPIYSDDDDDKTLSSDKSYNFNTRLVPPP